MTIVLLVAVVAAVFMAIAIGASSVSPSFAPVNSNYSNELKLALLAGVFALLGAVLQGEKVSNTIGSGLLLGNIGIFQAATILLVASALVIVSVVFDYPMPTAFTVVGAVVGSSFSFGQEVVWSSVGNITLFWFLTPVAALVLGYILARVMRRLVSRRKSKKAINMTLLLAGCYVAYTAGAASVGLAIGPLSGFGFSPSHLLLLGGVAILFGSWIYSPKIIHAVSYDYSNVGPRRSAAALLASGIIAQVGIQLGVPVSFNLAIIPAVVGSGLSTGLGNKNSKKIFRTVMAWVFAFLLAGFLTFLGGNIWAYLGLL
ncbi:MAG: inorganic phosphate transporter [Candidatus Aenigmatarchaeota archaeon]